MLFRLRWVAALLLAGCATVPTDGQGPARLYFGAVTIRVPATSGRLRAVEVRSFGVGYDGSAFLGWRSGRYVYARPGECALTVLLLDTAAAEHFRRLAASLGDTELCIADFATPSSPQPSPAPSPAAPR